jgi:hypothetical protein
VTYIFHVLASSRGYYSPLSSVIRLWSLSVVVSLPVIIH